MTTRVTEGARQERYEKKSSFFFSGGRSTLARAWTSLAKSEEKETGSSLALDVSVLPD